jgi:hypothetical protein
VSDSLDQFSPKEKPSTTKHKPKKVVNFSFGPTSSKMKFHNESEEIQPPKKESIFNRVLIGELFQDSFVKGDGCAE